MLALFAQANNNNAGLAPIDALLIGLTVLGVMLLVWVSVEVFFLLTLYRTLSHCRPKKRTMEPGLVWLNLIPLFHMVWMFITVIRISESLRKEFRSRGLPTRGDDFGNTLGITTCSLIVAANIPYLGICFLFAGLICLIIYWLRIAGYNAALASDDEDYDEEQEEDHQDEKVDDRPPKHPDYEDDGLDDRPWERR
jgi:hypothetical protein